MIPYDDLVIALQTWRARQGLPVAQLSGATTPPPVVTMAGVVPAPRGAPPATPPSRGFLGNVATPPPLAPLDDTLDVDAAALIEESSYPEEGGDFAVAFGAEKPYFDAEETAIGGPPRDSPDDTETVDQTFKQKTSSNDEW